MANELNTLIERVSAHDPSLAAELRRQVTSLTGRRANGLNFERHLPEQVTLVGRPITVGDKVRFIPERGETKVESDATWVVTSLTGPKGGNIAELLDRATGETVSRAVEDLVFVADFRDPIYPGLVSTGRVERGGGKPFHTVINSENYHALEALTFTHAGKVDAIYIDPPYNTGARDWKYNNDYVDDTDAYRHSKWLSFMERRLQLAKKLLNPADSVLIVTIDEKEYLRLGLLLEQTFPSGRITMVTSSIIPGGSTRTGTFNRASEYIYFVQFGSSAATALPLSDEWNPVTTKNKQDLYWARLIRSGTQPFRTTHPNLFYPIHVRETDGGPVFHSVGEPHYGPGWEALASPAGCESIWPIRADGREGRWQIQANALRALLKGGYARLGPWKKGNTTVYYLKQGERRKVEEGVFTLTGRRSDGSVITDGSDYQPRFIPTDVWRLTSHDAGNSGSRVIAKFIPGRKFDFPKSLYAVEDALRFFVIDKPEALVLDFFSGSGTTAHAVMRLNKQDGGHRRSISVTNNEVSVDEQKALIKKGLRPGDAEWESLGICDYITKPRIAAAITGRTPDGAPIKGDYKFTDEFPMADGFEENVEFLTLTYLNPTVVGLNLAFASVAPLLWMRAGSQGRRIEERTDTFDVADTYAVLFDVDASGAFLKVLDDVEDLRVAYIVTDDETQFQAVASQLPKGVEAVRLYETYLRTFEINTGRA
jgi:adenine-specific DNA-methyltransferase